MLEKLGKRWTGTGQKTHWPTNSLELHRGGWFLDPSKTLCERVFFFLLWSEWSKAVTMKLGSQGWGREEPVRATELGCENQYRIRSDRGDRGNRYARQSFRIPGNKRSRADFPLGSLKVSCSRMPWQFSGHFNMSKNDYGMNIDRDLARMMSILPIIFGNKYLVGGLEHFLFSTIYGIIIPTDELIFFRGVAQPPTSNPTWCDVGFILLGPLFSLKWYTNGTAGKTLEHLGTITNQWFILAQRVVQKCW